MGAEDTDRRMLWQRFVSDVRELTHGVPQRAALKLLLHVVSGLPWSWVRPRLQEVDEAQASQLVARFTELRARVAGLLRPTREGQPRGARRGRREGG